ncbi:MAG: hypothetical protein WKF57_11105 [Nakamurella sp.]
MSPFLRTSDAPPDPSSTAPRERDPLTGRAIELDHDDKNSRRDDRARQQHTREPRARRPRSNGHRMLPGPRWLVPVGAAGATVAVVVGVVLATTRTRAPVLDADAVTVTGAASDSITGSPGGAPLPGGGTSPSSGRPTAPSPSATASPAGPISVPVSRSGPASSTPARSTPTSPSASASPSSSPSTARPTPGPPAALTRSRIWGYSFSGSANRVVNPDLAGVSSGDYQGVLRCPGGSCPQIAEMIVFSAASPRILSRRSIGSTARSRCEPLVFTVDLRRPLYLQANPVTR